MPITMRQRPSIRVTSHRVQENAHKNRQREAQMQIILASNADTWKLTYAAKCEAQIALQREAKDTQQAQAAQREEEEQAALEEARKAKEREEAEAEAMAVEALKAKQEREQEELQIQRILETSDELRELEKTLQVAYMNKERAAQLEERALLQQVEKERNQHLDIAMKTHREQTYQTEQARLRDPRFDPDLFKGDVHKQLQERERQRQELEATRAAQERAMVQATVAKIEQEEAENRGRSQKKKDSIKQQLLNYQEEHQRFVAAKKREEEEEEARIQQYEKARLAREDQARQQQNEKKAAKDARIGKIVEEAKRKLAEEEELRALHEILMMEEAEAARLAADQAAKEKKLRDQESMQVAEKEQRRIKARQLALERLEEQRIVQEMQAKFAAEMVREQQASLQQKKAKEQYYARVHDQIQDQHARAMVAGQKDLAKQEAEAKEAAYKQSIIEEARKRLLQQAMQAQLGPYLPPKAKGLLQLGLQQQQGGADGGEGGKKGKRGGANEEKEGGKEGKRVTFMA